ncbi:MAG: 16S rRNA pseudouridine(516) synthase, partial [Lachnospiraceae bacterium]|nr:16S rRNA pseudouridine(516) synthase [Lachnospiraceae bacterium]
MRLDKFLCDMQIGTRSYVKDLIKKGQVSVNDTLIRKPDFQVNTACDLITCMGNTITYQNLY